MSIKPTVEDQKLIEQLNEGVTTDKSMVSEFFTNNIVSRMLAYTLGWHYLTGKPVKIACQADGAVRVAMTSSNVENNETIAGTSANAWSGTLSFGAMATVLDVWAWDNALLIQRSIDGGVTWQDSIEIPAGGSMSVNTQTDTVRVQSQTLDAHCRYQIVGWY